MTESLTLPLALLVDGFRLVHPDEDETPLLTAEPPPNLYSGGLGNVVGSGSEYVDDAVDGSRTSSGATAGCGWWGAFDGYACGCMDADDDEWCEDVDENDLWSGDGWSLYTPW